MNSAFAKLAKPALIATGFLILATTQMAAPAYAYECKASFKQGEALGNTRHQGKANARAAWTTLVKNTYGLQWSSWDIAASKSQTCEWTGIKFYCIVKAEPCLYVVQ